MKRSHILLYQAIGWTLVIGYSLLGYDPGTQAGPGSRFSARELLLFRLAFWLSLLVLFYYCFLFVFPWVLRRGRRLAGWLALLGTPLVFGGTRYLLDEVLTPWVFGTRNYFPGTTALHYLLDNLYFLPPTVVLAGVAVAVREALAREQARASQQRLLVLEQARTQAELAFLRAQLNPHFLYNTLNYLYATAYPVSEPLAEAVLRLSDLMRYMLHESPDGQVALSQEVAYLDNYLALHRLRFEGRFFVEFRQVGAAVAGQRVAALLLIPLVENALKHGILNQPAHPVVVELTLPSPNHLCFSVCNGIGPRPPGSSTGVGLPTMRRRLALLYPGRHTLRVHDDGLTYRTQLELRL